MKTARFSKVVEKSGKPEIHLPLSKNDPTLKKAMGGNRVMTLLGEAHGSKNDYGTVGFEKKVRGQFLIFPRSLKPFEGMRVVGINYSLFSDYEKPEEGAVKVPKRVAKKPPAKLPKKSRKTPNPKEEGDGVPEGKVVPFPPQGKEEEQDESLVELKGYARKALQALEKGNQIAAYNLLKRLLAAE